MAGTSYIRNGVRYMAEGGVVRPQRRPSLPINPIGQQLISDLQKDFGVPREVAAGIVGQLAHESGNFNTLQEIDPLVEGSRGGWGYSQWTGPRRKEFEAYAAQRGLDPRSYEANYGNLVRELRGAEGKALWGKLHGVTDARQAGRIFTDTFLRPGIPGYASRDRYTEAYLGSDSVPAGQYGNIAAATDKEGGIPEESLSPYEIRMAALADMLYSQQESDDRLIELKAAPVESVDMIAIPEQE
jgi:hypothetical protein